MDEFRNKVISIKKNSSNFDPVAAANAEGCVNTDPWNGFAPRTAKLNFWYGHERQEENVLFYENDIEVEIQLPSWDWKLLNQGSYALDPGSFAPKQLIDPTGTAVGGKILLALNGQPLPQTTATQAITAGQNVSFTVANISNFQLAQTIGNVLQANIRIDPGLPTQEDVAVTATNNGTLTITVAAMANNHANGCRVVGLPTYLTFKRRSCAFAPLNLLTLTG